MRTSWLAGAAALPLIAMSGPAAAGPDNVIVVNESINGVAIGDFQNQVVAAMGRKPLKVKRSTDQGWGIKTLYYPRRFTVTMRAGDGVIGVRTMSPRVRTPENVAVGSTFAAVNTAYSPTCQAVTGKPGRWNCRTTDTTIDTATVFQIRGRPWATPPLSAKVAAVNLISTIPGP